MLLWFPALPSATIELFASATPQVWMLSKRGWIASKNFAALFDCFSKTLLRLFSLVPQLPDPGDEFQTEFSFVDGRRSSLVRRSTGFYRSYIRRGGKDRRLDEVANGSASRNASNSQPIFSGLLLHESGEPPRTCPHREI